MPRDLLYEIGVEEIPASFVIPALEQMENSLREGLGQLRLEFGEITTYGTPRRLAVIVRAIADRQPDVEQEYKGPPADHAYDGEGNPTKAAEGFAKSKGLALDDLEVRETDKGTWLFGRALVPGEPAGAVLPELLESATTGLSFPKSMRWGDLDIRFARPIRWLVAMLGDQVLDLSLAGVTAGNVTRGHRFLGEGEVTLAGADDYVDALRRNYVLADHRERRESIRAAAEAAAEEVGGKARIDEDLLTEVGFLIEWPTCLWGKFDERYLSLPEPVIVTVMQGHQRYFPVEDDDGKLMPYFLTVRNGGDKGIDTVRAGNEKVIVPRLADAEFYLTEDLKQSLEDRITSLERVTFVEGLGSLADKTSRLEKLVTHLAVAVPEFCGDSQQAAERAAHLSKADLVTLMVGDSKLGELQGVIGGEYASRLGESDAVATAIAEQYRPRGVGDSPPGTPAGTLLSIADKTDALAACFRLGQVPTGSADPFALRRQAQGLVEILLAHSLSISLPELIAVALELLPEPQLQKERDIKKALEPPAAADALLGFFGQRIDYLLTRDGATYDISRAVLAAPWDDALETYERGRSLQTLREEDADLFDTLVTAAERPARITRPEELPDGLGVDEQLFEAEWEKKLWSIAQATMAEVSAALGESPRDYSAAMRSLAGLAEPIHRFFEEVMVMVEDEAIRNNRLAMLREIDRQFLRLADFLQIVREGE